MQNSIYNAVIVAGGSGSRMNSEIPKQFLLLDGLPIIMHTISRFANHELRPNIIVVLSENSIEYWQNLIEKFEFTIPHQITVGGKERFYSVQNTLHLFNNESIIAIHDAVRPFISPELITRIFNHAKLFGNAIPAIDSRDSIRILNENLNYSIIDRNRIKLIQTPQAFNFNQLKNGYDVNFDKKFTDDASVVENAGYKINLLEGEINNIKITYQEDYLLANYLIKL